MKSVNSGCLYGAGVFTTIAIQSGKPLFWEKHWERLNSNAFKIGIDLSSFSQTLIGETLEIEIAKHKIKNGRARITFFDERPSNIWPVGTRDTQLTSVSILISDHRLIPDLFRLTVSPYPVNSRSPLAGVKSCNYLENILAVEEAKERGFHEAVRLNENGIVTSGCMANVFWGKGGKLFTPSLTTGCLPGTTREFVLENLECREVEASIGDLNEADSIFLTSAGLGVVEVAEFGSRPLARQDHPILDLLPKHI